MSGQPPRRAGPPAAGNGQAPRSAGKPRQGGGAKYTPAASAEGEQATPTPGGEKLASVQDKIDTVRGVMQNNMQMALDRGERLEVIEQKSDVLLEDSNKFQASAKATRQMFCRRHWRNVLIITILATVLLALVIWWASGGSSSS
jgi:hypothetical protein